MTAATHRVTRADSDSAARGVEVPPTGRGAVVRRVDEMTAWDGGDDPVECS